MKNKLIKLVFPLIALIALSACGLKDQFKDDADLTSIKGILTEQGSSDTEKGTHLLTDDDGEVTPLRSLSVNLSSVRYLDNKIEVLGFMNEEDGVFEVTGVSVLELLSDEREAIAELKEYQNPELGFEIKYYSDWSIEESGNGVTFSKESDRIVISQFPFNYSPTVSPENGDSDTALTAYFVENYPEIKSLDSMFNKIGVDDLDAVKLEQENVIEYFLYRFGFIYKIAFIPGDTSSINKSVFTEMLAGFRFVVFDDLGHDVEETENKNSDSENSASSNDGLPELDMNLTTFESLPYHFSGKYPSSWYYAGQNGTTSGVLHHYGFSDESVTEDNELITLDVLSGTIPSGKKSTINGREFTIIESGGNYTVYTKVEDKNYKVNGDSEYKDLILVMAANISATKTDEE